MIVKGYELKELQFVGFWDNCMFKHPDSGCGYLFEDKDGKTIQISYADIKKAKRGLRRGKKNVNV